MVGSGESGIRRDTDPFFVNGRNYSILMGELQKRLKK